MATTAHRQVPEGPGPLHQDENASLTGCPGPRGAGKPCVLSAHPSPPQMSGPLLHPLHAQRGPTSRPWRPPPPPEQARALPECQAWLTPLPCHATGCFGFPEEQGRGGSRSLRAARRPSAQPPPGCQMGDSWVSGAAPSLSGRPVSRVAGPGTAFPREASAFSSPYLAPRPTSV